MAEEKEYVTIEAAGLRAAGLQPLQALLPRARLHQARPGQLLRRVPRGRARHLRERPTVMKRWVDGVAGQAVLPEARSRQCPRVAADHDRRRSPAGARARELVVNDAAHLVWGANLGVIDWNPWPVRRADLDHPDELRVDLDPQPDVPFAEVRQVALGVREVLEEHGLRGFPKTSGSRGIHIFVRIRPSATSTRCAAPRSRSRARSSGACPAAPPPAGGRSSARASSSTTTRTPATAPSPRPTRCAPSPDARVSCPLEWEEVADVEPAELRLDTVPARLRERGDPAAEIDRHAGSLDALLELADARRARGPRRRALAAALPQAARRAAAGAAEPREAATGGGARRERSRAAASGAE